MNLQKNIRRVLREELNESNFLYTIKDSIGRLLLRDKYNFKPSLSFDKKFGTNISQKYDYPFGLNQNKIWRIIDSCNEGNEKNCVLVKKIVDKLGDYFPYPDYNNLPFEKKVDILQGMVSNFNYDDIISFSVEGKTGENNELEDEVNELQNKINYTIQWVPSKKTIEKIKNHMNLQESIRRVLREGKLHATPQELIKNLPKELKELLFKQWGAKQNPEWHPEGNTLKHIIVVIKRAYHHYPDDPNMVMAALFHDLGKIDTYKINPKTNQPTAYGHEDKSTDYVEKFKNWIESFEGMDVEEIKYLVKNHMKVKPSTWDQMKDKKKEPIMSHPAFDKLMGFTDKLDGGGTDLKESIRKVLKEEDKRQRYLKSTDSLRKVITLFLNNYIEDGDRKIGKKSRNYGNLREDWCVNGKEVITAIYYYEDGKFYSGSLLVTKTLIEKIMKIFNVRKNFLMSVVEEWYEDTMIPKFEQIVGETGFYFDDVDLFDRDHDCIPEPVKPEDITDEEMIEFIVSNTLYRRDEVINQIESGERDLEDFYLDIVHTAEDKKRY